MSEFEIELSADDQKMLQVMDEIYYLDWRENDDDETTAGWRHPGYFLEVGQPYDFEKLVGAGLAEKHSNPDYLAYRISMLGSEAVKSFTQKPTLSELFENPDQSDRSSMSDEEFYKWLSKHHGQPPSPRHG